MNSIIYKYKNNLVLWNRLTLTFSMVWALINSIYNLLIGIFDKQSKWSWFYGLTIWFGILFIIKLILLITSYRMVKNKSHIRFKSIAIVYLFINVFQVALITLMPKFVGTVFAAKLKGITIVNLITNLISLIVFISCFSYIDKTKFTLDEYSFLKTKQYIGRSEGLFTVMILIFNILMILVAYKVVAVNNNIIANIYLGIGATFVLGNLIAAIWLRNSEKFVTKK